MEEHLLEGLAQCQIFQGTINDHSPGLYSHKTDKRTDDLMGVEGLPGLPFKAGCLA